MIVNNSFDDNLFSILKECKSVPIFFDVIFGFLKRRTDFYIIKDSGTPEVGLPEGFAEKTVRNCFMKWQNDESIHSLHNVVAEEIVHTEVDNAVIEEVTSTGDKAINSEVLSGANNSKCESNCVFNTSDYYNGAIYDNYSWSQTISDIDLIVKLPQNIKSKNLKVDIVADKITVKMKTDDSVLLEGKMSNKCKPHETVWTIDDKKLLIHLEKFNEIWWDRFLSTDAKLDLSKMDCIRPFEDLSDEAQAKIEELAFNQERKRMGLPTTEQMALEKTLHKAWNAEGSPFSGPFDPKSVTMMN